MHMRHRPPRPCENKREKQEKGGGISVLEGDDEEKDKVEDDVDVDVDVDVFNKSL